VVSTDKINIPVGLALDPSGATDPIVAKIVSDFEARLKQELIKVSSEILKGKFPSNIPTVTGREEFEAGGRKFEISGSMKPRIPSEEVEGEGGELNVATLTQFSATIKEIKDRLNKGLTADSARLKEFKESIRFQPLQVKLDSMKKFVSEFGDINNELTHKIENIGKRLESQKFSGLKEKIQQLSPEDQIRAIEEFTQSR